MMLPSSPLTLIAWGLEYERLLKDTPQGGFQVPRPMLDQYIAAANAALVQQREQERKKAGKKRSGRPRGGMGEQRIRLIESGVREEDADRIVAQQNRKPAKSVKRAAKRVSKKPPR